MENRSYRFAVYGSKRRRLEPGRRHMVPTGSTTTPNGHNNGNSGFFGLIRKFLAPVTNFFRTSSREVTANGESSCSSSSSSGSPWYTSRQPVNGSSRRVRRKRSEESKNNDDGDDDEVIIIDQEASSFAIPTTGFYSGECDTHDIVEDKENERQGISEELADDVAFEKTRKLSDSQTVTSLIKTSDIAILLENSSLDQTLTCRSPSPQPEHSISRQISPSFSPATSGISVDRWQRRRTSSSARNSLSMNRYSPYRFFPSTSFKTNKERRFGGEASVVDKESKERYRKFLEEAGILKTGVVSSHHHERNRPCKTSNYLELLQRGQAALDSISRSGSLSTCTSRKGSTTSSSDDVVILEKDGNRKDKSVVERANRVTEERKSSEEICVVWDSKHRDDFKALWEEEKNTKLLAEHRLAMHRHQASIRDRRAKELRIEKSLIEQARRDEELSLEEELRKKLTLTGYIFRPRKLKDEFPELSDDAALLVERVWNQKLPHNERFVGEITRKDLLTLKGLDWLNDEVINFYMNLICERAKSDQSLPKVYAFSTFFYPTLSGKGYASVRRWTRKVDIFAYELLLVPVHLGAHWCLAVVDFKNRTIEYYDSMGGSNDRCLHILSEYLCEESLDKRTKEFDLSEWELVNHDDIPQQMNGSDCGMFACKFAEYASRRAEISFNQEHMPYFRERMVYEICRQKLL